jgi:GNAT superfamily N-acetyltransferase
MPIRFATVKDIPALVKLGKHMHGITRFKSFVYSEERVAKALLEVIEKGSGRYICFVAEDSTQHLAGVLLAVLEQHIFSDQIMASVVHYDVLPERRMGGHGVRLLRAFEQWCQNRKVAEINLGINSLTEMESVGGFVRKMGYVKVGENFVKGTV